MTTPIGKALGEGNCVGATQGGEEAGAKAVRLRTETSYKAGSTRQEGTTRQSRSQSVDQVKDELVQRKFMLLSGETCIADMRVGVAPASKACLKAWNRQTKVRLGGAGVSRGRSTDLSIPMTTGRTER